MYFSVGDAVKWNAFHSDTVEHMWKRFVDPPWDPGTLGTITTTTVKWKAFHSDTVGYMRKSFVDPSELLTQSVFTSTGGGFLCSKGYVFSYPVYYKTMGVSIVPPSLSSK